MNNESNNEAPPANQNTIDLITNLSNSLDGVMMLALSSSDPDLNDYFNSKVIDTWNKLQASYLSLNKYMQPWEVYYGAARLLEAVYPFMEPVDVPLIRDTLRQQYISDRATVEKLLDYHWNNMPLLTAKSNVLRLAFYKKYTGGAYELKA